MKPLFSIYAINKLTRELDRISVASTDYGTLEAIQRKFLKKPSRKRTHIYPRIKSVTLNLF